MQYEYARDELIQFIGKGLPGTGSVPDVALRVSMLDSLYGYFFPVTNQTVERGGGPSYES